MPVFRYQSIHTLLDIDTFPPSFLFTLVNNNTSIVNTHFFSLRHLIHRKVLMSALIFTRYIVFDMMPKTYTYKGMSQPSQD